jgi:hypothetical protein
MNAHAITRFDTVNPPRAKLQFRRRGLGAAWVGNRRMAEPGYNAANSALPIGKEGLISEASSIEEAMARFVDANPAQLYRGGA